MKTPNRTLSGLVSVSLITKETNTGKCRRSGFGEESALPLERGLAHAASAAALTSLADSVCAHSMIRLLVDCFLKEAGA